MFNKIRNIFVAGFICSVFAGPQAAYASAGPLNAERLREKLDAFMPQAMEQARIPGAAVVVTYGDALLFSKGYGYADLERQTPMDPAQTVLRLGSLTKTLTAAAVLQLTETEALHMHTDIRELVPGLSYKPFSESPITLHDLLTHTAGLDEAIHQIAAASPDETVPLQAFLRHYLRTQPPVREAGTQYAYSNAGIGLAALAVESASGLAYQNYVKQHLLAPLDMASAGFNAAPSAASARAYTDVNGSYEVIPPSYPNIPAAGGISATAEDWSRFMIALANEGRYGGKQVLGQEGITAMAARQYTEHPGLEGIGYGLFRNRLDDGRLVWFHNGDIDGFAARMEMVPADGLGILVVLNGSPGDRPLREHITRLITEMLPAPAPDQALPSDGPGYPERELKQSGIVYGAPLHEYEGRYTLSLAPHRGPGKWLYWLGYQNFTVQSSADGLLISGPLPDEMASGDQRLFREDGNGLFKDGQSGETVFFRRNGIDGKGGGDDGDGGLQLVFPAGVSIERQSGLLNLPLLNLCIYLTLFLFWIALTVALTAQAVRRLIRRKVRPKGWAPAFSVSGLLSVYLIGQLLYGNSQALTQGYPLWYAQSFLSLPLLGAAPACALAFLAMEKSSPYLSVTRRARAFAALTVLAYAGSLVFLLKWGMLSI